MGTPRDNLLDYYYCRPRRRYKRIHPPLGLELLVFRSSRILSNVVRKSSCTPHVRTNARPSCPLARLGKLRSASSPAGFPPFSFSDYCVPASSLLALAFPFFSGFVSAPTAHLNLFYASWAAPNSQLQMAPSFLLILRARRVPCQIAPSFMPRFKP